MSVYEHCYHASTSPPWLMLPHSHIWEKIFHLGKRRQWPKKARLFDLGNPAEEVILILEGLVKILAVNWNGEVRNLGILGPGSILGEAAFFCGSEYRHTIDCVEPCRGIAFSKDVVLEEILPKHEDILLYLLRNLAGKSFMMSTQVECGRFMSSEQHTAHFLYHLAEEQKNRSWIYQKISSLSLITLAEMLGMHRVTLTRIINNLKKQNIISICDSHLVVVDTEALAAILYGQGKCL